MWFIRQHKIFFWEAAGVPWLHRKLPGLTTYTYSHIPDFIDVCFVILSALLYDANDPSIFLRMLSWHWRYCLIVPVPVSVTKIKDYGKIYLLKTQERMAEANSYVWINDMCCIGKYSTLVQKNIFLFDGYQCDSFPLLAVTNICSRIWLQINSLVILCR